MSSGNGHELREALEYRLLVDPGQTARRLASTLQTEGLDVDKSQVNSVLYRYSDTFQNDGAVPPRWSLAEVAPLTQARVPHRVSGLGMANWKAFEQVGVAMAGVTLLYGENSAGKSSILQGLLLMKQSWGHGALQWKGDLGSFGWYQHVIHRHDEDRELTLAALWGNPSALWGTADGGDEEWSVLLTAVGLGDLNYDDEHAISRFRCAAGTEEVTLFAQDFRVVPQWEQLGRGWIAVRGDIAATAEVDLGKLAERGQVVGLGSDELGFPDVDNVRAAPTLANGTRTPAVVETLDIIQQVLQGARALFDAVVHIGPYRTVRERLIRMSWAMAEADYLARLANDSDLLADVNEWLTRFEVPYALEIARYGDDEGDEVFELNLVRVGGFAESVQLRDVGFGVSQLLPMITQLLGNREKTIMIEEPEAHVHPRLQSVLGDLFVTSMQDYGNVLIVETHSEPILLRLQRRVAEGRIDSNDVAVKHVVRHGAASEIEEVPIEDNGQLDYRWPGGFFDNRMDDLVAILDPRPDE